MKVELAIPEGRYVVAVSGGVDSIVLLDLLRRLSELSLVVAHFDHGIRLSSKLDRLFVAEVAGAYGLPFVFEEAKLGAFTSEEHARVERYKFLSKTLKQFNAQAIILAHHRDDQIETAVINLMRGTGRLGLSSLRSNSTLLRPLLNSSKADLLRYAQDNKLSWREDESNLDTRYLRNYVRHELLPRFSDSERHKLITLTQQSGLLNKEIDKQLRQSLKQHLNKGQINRQWFIMLPHSVAKEVVAAWLRQNGLAGFNRKSIERAVVAAKTYRANTQIDIYNGYALVVKKSYLALSSPDR